MRSLLNNFHYFLFALVFHGPGGSPQRIHLKLCCHSNKDTLQGQLGRSVLLCTMLCSPPRSSRPVPVYVLGQRTCPQLMAVSAVSRKALHYSNVILQNNGFWRNSFAEAEAACRKAKVLGDCGGQLQMRKPRGGRARKGHCRNTLP